MGLSAEIDSALLELLAEFGEVADGRSVTIYGSTSGQVYTGDAIVNGGESQFEDVPGGYYAKIAYVLTIPKSLLTFEPTPGMLVVARGQDLRIPDDGVSNKRAHWRIATVARDS